MLINICPRTTAFPREISISTVTENSTSLPVFILIIFFLAIWCFIKLNNIIFWIIFIVNVNIYQNIDFPDYKEMWWGQVTCSMSKVTSIWCDENSLNPMLWYYTQMWVLAALPKETSDTLGRTRRQTWYRVAASLRNSFKKQK